MDHDLGKIKKLDVRKVWSNEASDFAPWLAKEENIALLGNAVGLELEVENTEVAVGPYSADILAKDTGTGHYVVIENQLGKTDHDHLGKGSPMRPSWMQGLSFGSPPTSPKSTRKPSTGSTTTRPMNWASMLFRLSSGGSTSPGRP